MSPVKMLDTFRGIFTDGPGVLGRNREIGIHRYAIDRCCNLAGLIGGHRTGFDLEGCAISPSSNRDGRRNRGRRISAAERHNKRSEGRIRQGNFSRDGLATY